MAQDKYGELRDEVLADGALSRRWEELGFNRMSASKLIRYQNACCCSQKKGNTEVFSPFISGATDHKYPRGLDADERPC